MYRIFFTHSPTDGHLDYFQILAIVNNTAVNIRVYISLEYVYQVSSDILPVVELPSHKVVPFKIFLFLAIFILKIIV